MSEYKTVSKIYLKEDKQNLFIRDADLVGGTVSIGQGKAIGQSSIAAWNESYTFAPHSCALGYQTQSGYCNDSAYNQLMDTRFPLSKNLNVESLSNGATIMKTTASHMTKATVKLVYNIEFYPNQPSNPDENPWPTPTPARVYARLQLKTSSGTILKETLAELENRVSENDKTTAHLTLEYPYAESCNIEVTFAYENIGFISGTIFKDTCFIISHDDGYVSGAFAAGINTKALVNGSTAFGMNNTVKGAYGFTAGLNNTIEDIQNAIAFGKNNKVQHGTALCAGLGLTSSTYNQTVIGQYNKATSNCLFIVGKGGSATDLSNALEVVKGTGNLNISGTLASNFKADYAEMFEWVDGNPVAEDRIGLLVALEGDKIRLTQIGDDVLGIVSGTAAIVGDSGSMEWAKRLLTDDYGRIIYEMIENDEGELEPMPKINPDYNPDLEYIPRSERPEWATVGLMGKLYVEDDGTCVVGDYGTAGINGRLTASSDRTNIRVMKRVNDHIVQVLLK